MDVWFGLVEFGGVLFGKLVGGQAALYHRNIPEYNCMASGTANETMLMVLMMMLLLLVQQMCSQFLENLHTM